MGRTSASFHVDCATIATHFSSRQFKSAQFMVHRPVAIGSLAQFSYGDALMLQLKDSDGAEPQLPTHTLISDRRPVTQERIRLSERRVRAWPPALFSRALRTRRSNTFEKPRTRMNRRLNRIASATKCFRVCNCDFCRQLEGFLKFWQSMRHLHNLRLELKSDSKLQLVTLAFKLSRAARS